MNRNLELIMFHMDNMIALIEQNKRIIASIGQEIQTGLEEIPTMVLTQDHIDWDQQAMDIAMCADRLTGDMCGAGIKELYDRLDAYSKQVAAIRLGQDSPTDW
jgi:hypothetical protein